MKKKIFLYVFLIIILLVTLLYTLNVHNLSHGDLKFCDIEDTFEGKSSCYVASAMFGSDGNCENYQFYCDIGTQIKENNLDYCESLSPIKNRICTYYFENSELLKNIPFGTYYNESKLNSIYSSNDFCQLCNDCDFLNSGDFKIKC